MKITNIMTIAIIALAAPTVAIVAQTTWYVEAGAAAPGSGTPASPFPTVQQGVDAAANGDTVLVGPGTYVQTPRLHFRRHGVHVASTEGPLATFLTTATPATSVVRFDQVGTPFAEDSLEGFTIHGGQGTAEFGTSSFYGGGILIVGARPRIERCVITDNHVVGPFAQGGGIAVYEAGATIKDCVISGNSATYSGGGYFQIWLSAPTHMTNCLVVGNTAGRGGGVYCEDSEMEILHCTIVDNLATADSVSDAVTYCPSDPDQILLIINCILRGSHPTVVHNQNCTFPPSLGALLYACNVMGGWTGQGADNFDADPLFRNAATGDYQLALGSRCIDLGSAAWALPLFDLLGAPRSVGSASDLGAFELATSDFPGPAAAGTGTAQTTLMVGGSTGGFWRAQHVPLGSVLTVTVAQPTSNPEPAHFILWGTLGIPSAADEVTLPFGLAPMSFAPKPLDPGNPDLFTFASTFGPAPANGLVSANPAAWTVSLATFMLPPLTFTLQGLIFDMPGHFATTNAVAVVIR